ncbi:gephyrin-like molybdotransferase Glp [Pseudogracilibacillus auburnensis]|uniref:Molybdopterin molybdenumtransferase n=1 Tax=Pseudogracilibacillus auburnensis TaxID=1494959 RepID=A0A2V3VXH4_9BACI|nr:gephyrin-like molybdotransferase Glp [Pseudogracilibacillus auburnensis]PXW85634.1 molybdopterin molybdochelatase [Pseudogracilibacillus auburnensis]
MIRKPIPVKEAVQHVINSCTEVNSEMVKIDNAYGRILKEPIVAKHDVPPFNRSAFDGYAIRAEDSEGASENSSISFQVIGEIGAGHVGERALEEKEAYRIMTGAILPPHADAIVMLEETEKTENGFTLSRSFAVDENISFQGEDAKEGEILIESGSLIHPGTVALLATFGYAKVKVAKLPVVSIISTGTELLDVEDELEPGKIRNSNGPMLKAQLDRMRIPYHSFGMMEDDLDACTELVEKALSQSDIVITTGGVSVGDYDYLPEIYKRIGAKVLFDKVMMRPGSVTTVAVLGDKLLFGLSGNPSACFTGFELFTRPALLTMMGCTSPYVPRMKATLGEDFTKANPFTRFVRAIWEMRSDGLFVVPAGFNKSNAVSSIGRGNCIIVLPSGSERYKVGEEVDVLLLGQELGVATWDL